MHFIGVTILNVLRSSNMTFFKIKEGGDRLSRKGGRQVVFHERTDLIESPTCRMSFYVVIGAHYTILLVKFNMAAAAILNFR